MKITKYRTLLNEDRLPCLVKEKAVIYGEETSVRDSSSIARVLNDVFLLDKETEEVSYLACFDVKMKLIGVFELSRGHLCGTMQNPREIMMKALLCNAANVILAHNHPSGDCTPSSDDIACAKRCIEAGKVIGIKVRDSLVIGDEWSYVSLRESGFAKF